MGHPSSDAVLTLDEVWPGGLRYRLGLEFRLRDDEPSAYGAPVAESKQVRIQIASPPPLRPKRKHWFDGLQLGDGSPFDRNDDKWKRLGVLAPKGGPKNLGVPDPDTVIYDGTVTVDRVSPEERTSTSTILVRPGEPVVGEAQSFLSVYYDVEPIGGERLFSGPVAVTYHTAGTIEFTKDAGPWIAIGLGFGANPVPFLPDNRVSADIIAPVEPA